LPISDLEEVQDMLFKKRLDFDKKLAGARKLGS